MTGHFVRPDVRAFLDALAARPRPPVDHGNVAALRAASEEGMAKLDLPVGELALTRDLVAPGPGGALQLRLFDARADRGPGPAVVFFHGGGYTQGSIATHAPLCAEIARQLDLPVISVEYRLAPEHPWPAAPNDAEAATRWIAEHAAAFDREVTALVLMGDSAGGNLTLVTALALRDRPAAAPVILQVAIYPHVDHDGHWDYESCKAFADGYMVSSETMRFHDEAYRPERGHWRATPLVADQTGAPPTLIVTASLDPLRDQGRAMAAKTIAAGVPTNYREVTGTVHGFASFRRVIPSAQLDLSATLALIRSMLGEVQAARPIA
jgi:acetyl esterase